MAVQAGDRFEIVIEDVGSGVDDEAQRVGIALEVGDQDLDRCLRQAAANLSNTRREDLRPTVRQVVAIHTRNDDVLEAHLCHCVGEALRLAGIERGGASHARPRSRRNCAYTHPPGS